MRVLLAILQAKLKKLDMADSQAMKQLNTSSATHNIVNHPKTNQPTVTSPPTPVASSPMVKSKGKMAKLKKLLIKSTFSMDELNLT